MNTVPLLLFTLAFLPALAYLAHTNSAPSGLRSAIKTAPLVLFTLAAIAAGAHPFLSAGLLLSALGDLALSRPGQKPFLYGLAAFALAHVLYALLFLSLAGAPLWAAFATAPVPAIAMLILALSSELWLAPHVGALRWPVRLYILLVGAMLLAALILPPAARLATLGATAFVASDLVLAIDRFRLRAAHPAKRPAGWAIWALYIAGQAMILRGVLAA